jgi:signal transduction histidine kinase
MPSPIASIGSLSDQALYHFQQDKTTKILHAMEKAGDDVVTGRITPEQSDIDIGQLLDELKLIQHEVETEQARRSRKKRTLHRTVLITISLLAAGFFYLVFFY